MRAPLNYAYTAAEVMAALPRTEAVDVEALPAELQRKARDHGDPLNSVIASEQLTTRHRQDVLWTELARAHPITTTAAKYGAPAAACIAAVRMLWNWGHQRGANGYDIASAAAPFGYLAVALILAVLLTAIARRRAAKAPHWVYSDDELRTLDAASIDWPAVPEELDRYANGEVLRREWHGTWLARIEPGGAALVWREPHLVAVAALIARDIRSSATWNSELLDLHRVRVDLDRTLDDIYLRAHRIWRARANLVAPATSDSRDVVVRRNTEIVDAANDAWHTLVDLVRQLQDYRDSLAPVDALHSEIAALRQSNLRITDDALRQLHVDAAGNELRAYELYSATTDQADLNANLTEQLATLRHTLATTNNRLALRAP
ncbi:hypothetical protein I549_4410 [Mycobacterium avium subsp. avium 2285 (R)]|nr:hypothetical protein I549_4410 [Mycobacterium avium subsp. avium 2285 (R)]